MFWPSSKTERWRLLNVVSQWYKEGEISAIPNGFWGSLFLSTYYLTPIMENFLSSVLHVSNTISSLFSDFRATKIVVNDGVQCKSILMMRAVSEEV